LQDVCSERLQVIEMILKVIQRSSQTTWFYRARTEFLLLFSNKLAAFPQIRRLVAESRQSFMLVPVYLTSPLAVTATPAVIS